MIGNAIIYFLSYFVCALPQLPLTLKVMNKINSSVQSGTGREVLNFLAVVLGNFATFFAAGLMCGLAKNAKQTTDQPLWKVGLLAFFLLFGWIHWELFYK